MSVSDHIRRYPNARTTTILYLAERERINEQLRREVEEKRRRDRIAKIRRVLWPSWVWRG